MQNISCLIYLKLKLKIICFSLDLNTINKNNVKLISTNTSIETKMTTQTKKREKKKKREKEI